MGIWSVLKTGPETVHHGTGLKRGQNGSFWGGIHPENGGFSGQNVRFWCKIPQNGGFDVPEGDSFGSEKGVKCVKKRGFPYPSGRCTGSFATIDCPAPRAGSCPWMAR